MDDHYHQPLHLLFSLLTVRSPFAYVGFLTNQRQSMGDRRQFIARGDAISWETLFKNASYRRD